MRYPEFRRAQWERRYDAHIAPIDRYVDELRTAVPSASRT